MSVCDAHEAAWGIKKNLSEGEGFLLAAQFMQNSSIQEKNVDRMAKLFSGMMSREQFKVQLESNQGKTPWIICEECADFLMLSKVDRKAAREAAKKWWQNESTPGHMPGQNIEKNNKFEKIHKEKVGDSFLKDLGQEEHLTSHTEDQAELTDKPADTACSQNKHREDYDTLDLSSDVEGELKGQILNGRYKILHRIDSGQMGKLYKAQDLDLDTTVVIKVLPAILDSNKHSIDDLLRRAEAVLRLSHPNIARLYAFQLGEAVKYLVVEYIEGNNLEDKIFDRGTMGLPETLKIFTQVAAGLDYAHSQGVLHGDIKPTNIVLAKDGNVKLTDLSIAKHAEESMGCLPGEKASEVLYYMAPEQLKGGEPDHRSDIYSMAASIYECLSGHPPLLGWFSQISNS